MFFKILLYSQIAMVKYINNLFGCNGTVLLLYMKIGHISSFLVACLIKGITMNINHNLCFYGMSFLFTFRLIHFSSISIYRLWNLLFCGIYKSKKVMEIFFNFLWRFHPFFYLIWYVELVNTFLPILQYLNISKDIVLLNQRESQPAHESCKDDNTQIALGICFWHLV